MCVIHIIKKQYKACCKEIYFSKTHLDSEALRRIRAVWGWNDVLLFHLDDDGDDDDDDDEPLFHLEFF